MAGPYHVLLSSAGRRVALLRLFREALVQLGLEGQVYAADISPLASAFQAADDRFLVPRCDDPAFIPAMLELCRRRRIRLLVPTIDPELPIYAAHRRDFAAIGTTVAVGGPELAALGADKVRTHTWLSEQGLPTVAQARAEQVLAEPAAWTFPLVVKPVAGSASKGVRLVRDAAELAAATRGESFIAQQVAPGEEYTLDAYIDTTGRCRCIVPRKRLEVRGGEVSKAQTVRSQPIEQLGHELCARLPGIEATAASAPGGGPAPSHAPPGPIGAINIQLFHEAATGRLAVIEINPRFGGGYPLTHAAGAPFTQWLLQELSTGHCSAVPDGWRNGVVMLRYDDAVFTDAETIEGQRTADGGETHGSGAPPRGGRTRPG